MNINELKQKRAAKVAKMKDIMSKAQDEKRSRNEEEVKEWESLRSEVESLDKDIDAAEYQEELNKEEMRKQAEVEGVKKNESTRNAGIITDKSKKPEYNIKRALTAKLNGQNVDGYEKEMHDEGVRNFSRHGHDATGLVIPNSIMRSFTVANNADHIAKEVMLNTKAVEGGFLQDVGVTTYSGLTSNVTINFTKGVTAGFLAEGATLSESGYTESRDTLAARRLETKRHFSTSYLSQTATLPDFLNSMNSALEKEKATEIMRQIAAITSAEVVPSSGTDGLAESATYADILKLMSHIEIDAPNNPAFVANKGVYYALHEVEKTSGNGEYVVKDGRIMGTPFVNAFTKAPEDDYLYYGDWSQAFVGEFGSDTEILINPYSRDDQGEVKVIFRRLADVIVNPYAFAWMQEISSL